MDPGIAELFNPTAGSADDMIMLPAGVSFFKLGNVFPELMLKHQSAIQEELHGVVQGGAADPVVVVFHLDIERFHIKVPLPVIDFIEDGKPLRGFPVSFLFDIVKKYLPDRSMNITASHISVVLNFFDPFNAVDPFDLFKIADQGVYIFGVMDINVELGFKYAIPCFNIHRPDIDIEFF